MPRTRPAKLHIVRNDPGRSWKWKQLAIPFAGLLVVLLVTGSQVLPTKVNVNDQTLTAQRAKWRNLHVTDYEVIARQTMFGNWDRWRAVVHTDPAHPASQETLTDFEYLGTNSPPANGLVRSFENSESVSAATVDWLFARVGEAIENPQKLYKYWGWHQPELYAQFDPVMGYPRSLTVYAASGQVDVMELSIESLKILK